MSVYKIIIWGTGNLEKELYDNRRIDYKNVIGFLETRKTQNEYRGLPVYDFESLDCDYDYIICAFYDSDSAYYVASEKRIDLSKVIFWQPGFERKLFNDSNEIADILQDEYEDYIRRYQNSQKLYKREDVEWINYWINGAAQSNSNRILLIGDSVIRELRPILSKNIADYEIDFLTMSYDISDENAYAEIVRFMDTIAKQYHYEIALYNLGFHHNSFHLVENSEHNRVQYMESQLKILRFLKQKVERCICIGGTPERNDEDRVDGTPTLRNAEIVRRNEITLEVSSAENIEFLDIYSDIKDKDFKLRDNVHYYQGAYEYISDLIGKKLFKGASLPRLTYIDTLEELVASLEQISIVKIWANDKEKRKILCHVLKKLCVEYEEILDEDGICDAGMSFVDLEGIDRTVTLSSTLFKELAIYFSTEELLDKRWQKRFDVERMCERTNDGSKKRFSYMYPNI